MDELLFQLKFSVKQLERQSKKCEKEQAVQTSKIKKALSQQNVDGARVYAENAIRKKNEGLNYLRLASRVDAVASRVQTALAMKQITKTMGVTVKGLEKAMQSMDLEKIGKVMDTFEKQFENLDVHAGVLENSVGSVMATTVPLDQVDQLIQQTAEEAGLEIVGKLSGLQPGSSIAAPTATSQATITVDSELDRRLAMLRN